MSKRSGSEERMEEGSADAKRRKTGHDDNPSDEEERMEVCIEDNSEKKDFWTTIPPEVVTMVLSRLPYEKLAELALVHGDWRRIDGRLVVRGLEWAFEAERKWLAWQWLRTSGLDTAFRCRVNAAWTALLYAFKDIRLWPLTPEDMTRPLHPNSFLQLARALDQAETAHREMRAMLTALQAHYLLQAQRHYAQEA